MMTSKRLVVMLTALDLEYTAVRVHLAGPELHRHSAGTRFEIGTIPGTQCRVALGLTGVGNQSSAVIAERSIQEFAPDAVLFVGVAGALWDKPGLGDVVVAERVYAYHGGTGEHDGIKARPRAWEAPHMLSQLAHEIERSGDWRHRLPADADRPEVRFGAIAAGEIVQNSRISREAQWIRDHYNDAIAIEMEAAGVAHAGHLNNAHVGIVRGISDQADGTKNTEGDVQWQPRAASNAAAFAVQLATELVKERTETAMSSNSPDPRPATNTVYNMASGQVGIQAATVTGSNVWMNTSHSNNVGGDLIAAVTGVRGRLDHDHANGEVDDETYEAACAELDSAEHALQEPGETGRKRSLLALKRLSGLVAGTTSAAAHVATVITAVNGLS